MNSHRADDRRRAEEQTQEHYSAADGHLTDVDELPMYDAKQLHHAGAVAAGGARTSCAGSGRRHLARTRSCRITQPPRPLPCSPG